MSTHQQVCHAWAHQTGRQRKGFNIFYEGDTIYSYGHHFPIARIVDVKGQKIVLFTTDGRSVSTAKHKTFAARAVSHLETIPAVSITNNNHGLNHDAAIKTAQQCCAKAKRARIHGDMHLEDARLAIHNANRLNELFDLGRAPITFESLGVTLADLEARLAAAREVETRRRAQEERDRFIRQEESRAAWLAGANNHFYGTDAHGGALLRVKDDVLQTSMGAGVPLAHAVRAFRFIKLVRERGTEWNANGHALRVGLFTASAIDADGTLRIGCHVIHWPEICRVAAQLGVIDAAPSDDALQPSTEVA